MDKLDEINITNILFKTIANTRLKLTKEEYHTSINFIKNNPEFSSKLLCDNWLKNKMFEEDRIILLKNCNIDILLNNDFFTNCTKSELLISLSIINNKTHLKHIIKSLDKNQIKLTDKDFKKFNSEKRTYIESLLVMQKIRVY